MENQTDSTPWLLAKIVSVWAAVGVTSWSEAASFMAFIYTCCLFGRWVWVHIVRPFCVDRGWLKALTAGQADGGDDASPL